DRNRLRHEGYAARFDLLDVEHLVDEVEKALAVALGDLDQLVLVLVHVTDRAASQELQGAEDRGERRAQLMAQGRGELAPHALRSALLRDVARLQDDRGHAVFLVGQRRKGPLAGKLEAIASQAAPGGNRGGLARCYE